MHIRRRRFLQLTAGAVALPAMPDLALAETYPTRPVHIIVSAAAGGSPDIIARQPRGMAGRATRAVVRGRGPARRERQYRH